jgi:hypothetical protein
MPRSGGQNSGKPEPRDSYSGDKDHEVLEPND